MATLRKDEALGDVFRLHDGVRAEPILADYLGSKKRAQFGLGIFR